MIPAHALELATSQQTEIPSLGKHLICSISVAVCANQEETTCGSRQCHPWTRILLTQLSSSFIITTTFQNYLWNESSIECANAKDAVTGRSLVGR